MNGVVGSESRLYRIVGAFGGTAMLNFREPKGVSEASTSERISGTPAMNSRLRLSRVSYSSFEFEIVYQPGSMPFLVALPVESNVNGSRSPTRTIEPGVPPLTTRVANFGTGVSFMEREEG